MKKFEYKTIDIKLNGAGIFGAKKAEGFEGTLAQQGANGWRYVDTLTGTGVYGEASTVKLIFERELN